MGGTAVDANLELAGSLAGGLERASEAVSRFEDKGRIAEAGFAFRDRARGGAPDFLVRVEQHDDLPADGDAMFPKGGEGKEAHHDARLHVKDSWAVGAAAADAERHAGECAEVPDGVQVAEQEDLAALRARNEAELGAEVIASRA